MWQRPHVPWHPDTAVSTRLPEAGPRSHEERSSFQSQPRAFQSRSRGAILHTDRRICDVLQPDSRMRYGHSTRAFDEGEFGQGVATSLTDDEGYHVTTSSISLRLDGCGARDVALCARCRTERRFRACGRNLHHGTERGGGGGPALVLPFPSPRATPALVSGRPRPPRPKP